jgi:RHS repeat-associated protein
MTSDPLSRRVSLTYANGTSSSYTYEIDNDLASLVHHFTGSNVSLGYDHNNVGNPTSFTCDDARFVHSPSSTSQVGYVSNALNAYTSVNGTTLVYDENGNLTSDGVNTYIYDAENRLTQVTTPQHSVSYAYGYLGRRIAKTVDAATTSYIYDGDQVIIEYDGGGQVIRRYVYGHGIDQPIAIVTPTVEYYYHFDGLGSVIALSDSTGNVVETYAYSPYGKVSQASSVGNPYLYTGREYDDEAGLYHYRTRYYDPEFGRFLQIDPTGYAVGLNLYAYVRNNPTRYVDPYGLAPQIPEIPPEALNPPPEVIEEIIEGMGPETYPEPEPPDPGPELPEPLDFTDPDVLSRDPAEDRPPDAPPSLPEEILDGIADAANTPGAPDAVVGILGLLGYEPATDPREGTTDAPGTFTLGVGGTF